MKLSVPTLLAGAACMLVPLWTHAQAPAADGAPTHLQACAACHGASGVSTEPGTPHIAAQRSAYIAAQLRAYRSGARENAVMNAVSASLTDAEIDALAEYYASRPGPADGTVSSPMLEGLVLTEFPFPADYESTFLRYRTTYPGNQVRHLYANDVAVNAASAGEPLPDGSYLIVEIFAREQDGDGNTVLDNDGQPVAGERTGFNVMAREAGWGDRVPSLLRNENWLYANLDARGNVNTGANQAACLACHVPLTEDSFVFTIEQLTEAARAAD